MMRLVLLLLALQILSACVAPVHRYTYHPPGAAMNLWGPYIHEAAQRFSIPQSWIRAIMNQESGGHQYLHGRLIRSAHGAVGLMQIKPETYAILAHRYHLGSDPYNPHDNIIAGSGYIRELYNRFGFPMFVAAYNCGPQCVENYRRYGTPLPGYARAYLAAVAPHLRDSIHRTAPVEVVQTQPNSQLNTGGDNTQESIESALQQATFIGRNVRQGNEISSSNTSSYYGQNYSNNMNTSSNLSGMTGVAPPIRADLPPPQSTSQAVLGDTVESLPSGGVLSSTDQTSSTQGTGQIIPASMAQSSVASPTIIWKSVPGTGNAIIQIGAFSTPEHAQKVIAQARRVSNMLQHAVGHVDHVVTSRGVSVWRTRLTGLPVEKEGMICSILRQKGITCVTVH